MGAMSYENVLSGKAVRKRHTRAEAAAILSAIELPLPLPHAPDEWPIGAAMLQFGPATPDGRSVREAGPDYWRRQLSSVVHEGFSSVEIPSAWLAIGEMERSELDELRAICTDLGLSICATSVVRRSIVEPGKEAANMKETLEAIDAAAHVGSPHVSLGLHGELTEAQRDTLWFWNAPEVVNPDDPSLWRAAVTAYQRIADHAASVGVEISLELYEGTFLSKADAAVALVEDIGRDNLGLNPDIGNLIRAPSEIEPWEEVAIKTLPYANYWHVKNYARAEMPARDVYLAAPTMMMNGLIDYRRAIAFAVAHGFRGAFLCENYGGDGLSVSAQSATYVRKILRALQE